MTCITEIVKMVTSETPADSACNALISMAARAAGYEPIMRKSQISKVCCYHETSTQATLTPTTQKQQIYIVC